MRSMALLIVGLAFALGLANRSWLAVVGAALLPGVLALLGAFDDGEGVGTFLSMSLVFVGLAFIGLILSSSLKRHVGTTLSA